jgi:hypothetical protein
MSAVPKPSHRERGSAMKGNRLARLVAAFNEENREPLIAVGAAGGELDVRHAGPDRYGCAMIVLFDPRWRFAVNGLPAVSSAWPLGESIADDDAEEAAAVRRALNRLALRLRVRAVEGDDLGAIRAIDELRRLRPAVADFLGLHARLFGATVSRVPSGMGSFGEALVELAQLRTFELTASAPILSDFERGAS